MSLRIVYILRPIFQLKYVGAIWDNNIAFLDIDDVIVVDSSSDFNFVVNWW